MSEPIKVLIYNDAELSCPKLTRQVRVFSSAVAVMFGLRPCDWHDFLVNRYRDLDVEFYTAIGKPATLPIHVFEFSDHDIDVGNAERVRERINEWFERICSPIPPHVTPYVPLESRERFRVLASLLIAAFPEQAADWPRIIPANDNWLLPIPTNDNQAAPNSHADEL